MDLTTGKITDQRKELIALGLAQVKVAAIQANVRAQEARAKVVGLQSPTTEFSGGIGGGFTATRRPAGAVGAISREVLAGTLDASTAIDRLDSLRKVGRLTDQQFADAASSVAALGIELGNVKINEAAERMLKGVGTADDRGLLLRDKKTRKPKVDRTAERLAAFGERAGETIARIDDQYNTAPKDIDRARQAVAELDKVIVELGKKKPPNFQALIDQAKAVKPLIADSLARPIRDMLKDQERQIELDRLHVAGNEADAAALQLTYTLMDKMGAESEDQLATMLAQRGLRGEEIRQLYDNLDVMRRQTREMQVQQANQQAFLRGLADVREDISASMQKALQSSSDVNKGVKEALKVREVETLLGGIGAVMTNQFRAFEVQAKERVRIATQYGFDVLAIEKRNAEDRAKLIDEVTDAQVGSLKRLVEEMKGGSLFEGSAVEQRTVLLASIEKAKADLNAGVEGAGDKLASLFEQLNSVSKEAYGTTGQFASDRSMILTEAQNAIARTTAQATAASNSAAGVSDPALNQTNSALDENNTQNAQVISLLQSVAANTAALMATDSSASIDVAALARTS